jgi:hypothetical protein
MAATPAIISVPATMSTPAASSALMCAATPAMKMISPRALPAIHSAAMRRVAV